MRKWVKRALTVLAASGALMAIAAFPAYAGQWKQDGNGWWWQNDDGTYPEWMWAWIDGNHDGIAENYYFDERGYLSSETENQGVQVNADGAMIENRVACTAQLPDGRDYIPGMAINGKLVYWEGEVPAERPEVDKQEKETTGYEEIDPYELAYRIVDLVNEERNRKGKGELAVNEELMGAAMLRAEEISDSFSHIRPDGSSCISAISIEYSLFGENIAWEKLNTLENIAETVTNGWLNSSGHKTTMMTARFEATGVGVYVDNDRVYIVQHFLK